MLIEQETFRCYISTGCAVSSRTVSVAGQDGDARATTCAMACVVCSSVLPRFSSHIFEEKRRDTLSE